jgi:ADP-ribose pyrophosphatase YjhB (NUDIX family)
MESQHAAAVLIVSPEGIPLIRDPKKPIPRYWKLPGGRSEGNESPEECAIREVDQEVGLKIDIDDLKVLDQEERFNHTLTIFRADLPSLKGLKKIGDEQEEIKVFKDLKEVGMLPDLFPNHKRVVQKAFVTELK